MWVSLMLNIFLVSVLMGASNRLDKKRQTNNSKPLLAMAGLMIIIASILTILMLEHFSTLGMYLEGFWKKLYDLHP